jgi:hypothetical protein
MMLELTLLAGWLLLAAASYGIAHVWHYSTAQLLLWLHHARGDVVTGCELIRDRGHA